VVVRECCGCACGNPQCVAQWQAGEEEVCREAAACVSAVRLRVIGRTE